MSAMIAQDPYANLPDPESQADFYADVPLKRLLAWVVDVTVIFAFSVLVSLLTLGIGFFLFVGVFMLTSFLYRVLTLAGGSSTWGMRLFGVEIRTHTGERLDTLTAFLHTLFYSVSFGVVIVQLASAVMMLMTPRGQGLSDMLLGTVAINRRART
ncbi:MAG: RDD family protein [Shimia sp.]